MLVEGLILCPLSKFCHRSLFMIIQALWFLLTNTSNLAQTGSRSVAEALGRHGYKHRPCMLNN